MQERRAPPILIINSKLNYIHGGYETEGQHQIQIIKPNPNNLHE